MRLLTAWLTCVNCSGTIEASIIASVARVVGLSWPRRTMVAVGPSEIRIEADVTFFLDGEDTGIDCLRTSALDGVGLTPTATVCFFKIDPSKPRTTRDFPI